MTIDEINTIRLALDTPENNRHYVKHTTDAKMILNKEQEAINYTRCCTELICDVCKGKGGIVMGRFMTCPKCKGVGKN
ncbi:hypothetical protein N9438_03680 [Flavobacteriaceae bacterium]|nr:hypothetical protein [Flavobacteriaceae bacterium]